MENRGIIVNEHPKSPVAEAYRTLRTNIQFSNIDKNIKTIVVTSSGPGEGKSTTSVNLAVTMAQSNKKVLLIDSDLRKPRVHKHFEVSNISGLTKVLAEDMDYKKVVTSTGIGDLDVLPSGPIPPNPSELMGSKKMKVFIEKVREDYDMVILDSPPVGLVTDASILSTIADGVILVCAAGQAVIDIAKRAKNQLENVKANILGVVLNKIPMNQGGYYKYHYQNAYYYQDDTEEEVLDKKGRRKRRKGKAVADA